MRIPTYLMAAAALLPLAAACTDKDKEVINRKGSAVDTLEFEPRSNAEIVAAQASAASAAAKSTSVTDTFVFSPKSDAEILAARAARAASGASAPANKSSSVTDTFVFKPKSDHEILSNARKGK